MKPHRLPLVLLAGFALALPATALERHDVVRRELQLAPGGSRWVEIDNVMGGVEVRAGAGDRVTVEIRRRAQARRESDLALAFEEVVLEVEESSDGVALVQGGPFRCDGRRQSRDDDERDHDAPREFDGSAQDAGRDAGRALGRSVGRSVGRTVGRSAGRDWGGRGHGWGGGCDWDPDYELDWQWLVTVPADVDLEVSTVNDGAVAVAGVRGRVWAGNVNGPLRLSGLVGAVRASTVNGGVTASYDVAPAADAKFQTVNGEIEIELPAASSADVELETMNGELWSDFEVNAVARESKSAHDGRSYRLERDTVVRIGRGGPRFECQTLNGDIVLRAR